MIADPNLLESLRTQAKLCTDFGSPFNGVMLARMAEDLEAGGPVAELLRPWEGAPRRTIFEQVPALRLVNAFNHLAASGEAPELAATYPSEGRSGEPEAAWSAARAAVCVHREHLQAFMSHEPQTNEVRRSAVLLAGFLTIAAETRLPMRCFEIGASAGLNLLWDRFRYELGPASWGDPVSPVAIATEWSGAPPPLEARIEVVERAACDRRPTDLTDPAARRRLLACIWPDQFERLERSRKAIDLVLAAGITVDKADALDWTRARVEPQAGAATVLYHSIFWQYLSDELRSELAAAIADIGVRASAAAPFAWLRMEPPPDSLTTVELRLTLWPGGAESRLAEVHPHGAWIKWAGARA